MSEKSQFQLLKERRFLPFFLTQFFGAFNDNVFKNALVIMIAYRLVDQAEANYLTQIAFGLFILPFAIFSAFAGQIADKYEKSILMKIIKGVEIVVMILATLGFYLNSIPILIFVLFLMGTQSTFFGPIKYSYLPEKLDKNELMGGNGLVEFSTFISILLGTMLGVTLMIYESIIPISSSVLVIALLGFFSSLKIPLCNTADSKIKMDWNPLTSLVTTLKFLPEKRVVFLSVLGISWFWFYGSVVLAQLPNYTKTVLFGSEEVVRSFLAVFSIGIGVGSLVCEKLSGRRVEIGLVPVGAIGLAVFCIDLYFGSKGWSYVGPLINADAFFELAGSYRIATDLFLIGVFGGIYIVPLYALVQERTHISKVSRIIAGNNIVNAIFMVLAALLSFVVINALGMTIPELFLITAILHVVVCIYIFTIVPEFILRLIAWFLVSLVYRVKYKGLEKIPVDGPVVLVCNHVSFMDPAIIMGRVRRPSRFVMYYKIFQTFGIKFLFKAAKTIPIAGKSQDPEMMEAAFASVKAALADGDVVCIFPEGGLTPDGQIGQFKKGIERIIDETPVPVVPMALNNLWGSMFSRYDKKVIKRRPRKFMAKVEMIVGDPVPPEQVTAAYLQQLVTGLKAQAEIANPLLDGSTEKTD